MPNYVLNRLTGVTEEKLRPYISVAEDGTEFLDFKKIIPMPKELDIESNTDSNLKKYGYKDWYSWRIANWGTKWNSWDLVSKENVFYFFTAWDSPCQIIEKLSGLLHCQIAVVYADECDNNSGSYIYTNGRLTNKVSLPITNMYKRICTERNKK